MTTELYFNKNIHFYNEHADDLAAQYLSKSFEEVHASWMPHLKSILNPSSVKPALISHSLPEASLIANKPSEQKAKLRFLDIGAGVGRDVKYLVEQTTENQILAIRQKRYEVNELVLSAKRFLVLLKREKFKMLKWVCVCG